MSRFPGILLGLLFATVANAHSVSTSHVIVLESGDPLAIEVDLAVRDVALALPLDADRNGEITWGEIDGAAARIGTHAASAVSLYADGDACALTPIETRIRRYADGNYLSTTLRAPCGRADLDAVSIGPSLASDPAHRMTITVDEAGRSRGAVLTAATPSYAFTAGRGSTFFSFFREGVHHILEGYDHLAFVISLLLPVVLVGGERRTTRDAFKRAALVVTAFTVAHSITLSLAALGWIWPAPKFVEAAIAISISLAALNNIYRVVDRRTAWLAGGFGLVHGFGFAGALTELGLPDGARITGLLGFNLGVEAGQLAVVLAVLPVLSLAAHWRGYRKLVMAPASIAIAALGGVWLVARLA